MDNTEINLLINQNKALIKQNKELQEELRKSNDIYPQTVEKFVKQENEQIKVIEKAINHFGVRYQVDKAVEEMGELIQALMKARIELNRDNIIEEIADVEIMLQQLCLIYQCPLEVLEMRKTKIDSLKRKIEDESI